MKQPFSDQLIRVRATAKVIAIKADRGLNDLELAELLELSKVTMYKRIRAHSWTRKELALINTLLEP